MGVPNRSHTCAPQTSEAIASLQGACDLAASHYGATHPSCLGVLLDTRDALLVRRLSL